MVTGKDGPAAARMRRAQAHRGEGGERQAHRSEGGEAARPSRWFRLGRPSPSPPSSSSWLWSRPGAEAAGMAGRITKVMLTGITADRRNLAGPGTADSTADIAITAAAGLPTNLLIADGVTTNVSGAGSDGLTIGGHGFGWPRLRPARIRRPRLCTSFPTRLPSRLCASRFAGTVGADTSSRSAEGAGITGSDTIGASGRRSTGDTGTEWRWRVRTGSAARGAHAERPGGDRSPLRRGRHE